MVNCLAGDQLSKFPPTRYMGSKSKIVPAIWDIAKTVECAEVIDLFSGSGIVSYMFKASQKNVTSNDHMSFAANIAQAVVANSTAVLPEETASFLADNYFSNDGFVSSTFAGLYFTDVENNWIDSVRTGIAQLLDVDLQAIAMAALVRACIKKRPRGIFTYVGMRYDDGRRDLQVPLRQHFLEAVDVLNNAVFDNGTSCTASCSDVFEIPPSAGALVYFDPPYYSPRSDNEYVRRYHFVEGLCRNWRNVEIQQHTKTKKFKTYPTPFKTYRGTCEALDRLFALHRESTLLVSYSSNSLPTKDEMVSLLTRYKTNVEIFPITHRYSFGNQGHKVGNNNNLVSEYLFLAQ